MRSAARLSVDLEGFITSGKESCYLTRCSESSIWCWLLSFVLPSFWEVQNICHLTMLEFFVTLGRNVGDKTQVGALLQQGKNFVFIDDFFACGVE